MEVSSYHINYLGVLCYAGLSINAKDLTIEHHNGRPHRGLASASSYEVGGVSSIGLIHGRPYRTFPINFSNR